MFFQALRAAPPQPSQKLILQTATVSTVRVFAARPGSNALPLAWVPVWLLALSSVPVWEDDLPEFTLLLRVLFTINTAHDLVNRLIEPHQPPGTHFSSALCREDSAATKPPHWCQDKIDLKSTIEPDSTPHEAIAQHL